MLFHGAELAFEKEADLPEVKALGRRTWEVIDFIVNGLGVKTWSGEFNATIALHRSCHLRGTASAESALTLLRTIKGIHIVEFDETEQCCGFGGTFSVTLPNISAAMGKLKLSHIRAAHPTILASLDSSCLMHMGGLAEKAGQPIKTLHVAQILRDALNSVSTSAKR
jgi:L-lactate dehydrogenase complex protein LldE